MSRRRAKQTSSLDLLLDTICNTFGSLVFLALLVSVLLSRTSRTPAQQSAGTRPAVSTADITRLRGQLAMLEAEAQEQQEILENYRAAIEHFAPADTLQLIEELQKVQSDADQNKAAQAKLLMAAAGSQAAAARARAAAVEAGRALAVARAEAAQVESELSAAKRERDGLDQDAAASKAAAAGVTVESTGRAPVERSTRKQEFGILLRYGRLYLIHRQGANGRSINQDDFVIVPGLVANVARARPGGGLPLASADAQAGIRERFLPYPASVWYPCVIVHPDSFEDFHVLKNWMVANGYEYRLIPTDEEVSDSGGTGGQVQ